MTQRSSKHMYVHQCISCMNKNILEKSKIFYKNIILLNVFCWYYFRFIVLYCFIFFYCFNVFLFFYFLFFFYFWWFTGVCLWGLPQAFLDSINLYHYEPAVKGNMVLDDVGSTWTDPHFQLCVLGIAKRTFPRPSSPRLRLSLSIEYWF